MPRAASVPRGSASTQVGAHLVTPGAPRQRKKIFFPALSGAGWPVPGGRAQWPVLGGRAQWPVAGGAPGAGGRTQWPARWRWPVDSRFGKSGYRRPFDTPTSRKPSGSSAELSQRCGAGERRRKTSAGSSALESAYISATPARRAPTAERSSCSPSTCSTLLDRLGLQEGGVSSSPGYRDFHEVEWVGCGLRLRRALRWTRRGSCYFFPAALPSPESEESAAMKASCGTSTRPTIFIRFLPSFCFSSSLRLRLMSPP